MAALLYYVGGSAAAYWVGSHVLVRSANASIDWILNSNAHPEIKELHTVKSICAMLKTYEHLDKDHPAFEALCDVKNGLNELQTAIERAKLRYEAHRSGYLTRFRTFDATRDNVVIEKKSNELMHRIDLFTHLVKLPKV